MTELSPEFQNQQDQPNLPEHLTPIHRDIIRLYFTYIDMGGTGTLSCFSPELLEDEQLDQFKHELRQVWLTRIWKTNFQDNPEGRSKRDSQFESDYTEIENALKNLTTDQIDDLSERIQAKQTAERAAAAPTVDLRPLEATESAAMQETETPHRGIRKRLMSLGKVASRNK